MRGEPARSAPYHRGILEIGLGEWPNDKPAIGFEILKALVEDFTDGTLNSVPREETDGFIAP